MTTDMTVYLACTGGHGRVLIDILGQCGVAVDGIFDDAEELQGQKILGVPVLGTLDALEERNPADSVLVNGLGNRPARGNSGLHARARVYARFDAKGFDFAQVISPHAVLSETTQIDPGVQILTRAVVHTGAHINSDAIINTGALIEHDVRIGPHSHIAPGAIVCGHAIIGDGVHVGAGAVITQEVHVGDQAMIAAGAVVTKDVPRGATVMGDKPDVFGTKFTVVRS